jgi:hypothetical protein
VAISIAIGFALASQGVGWSGGSTDETFSTTTGSTGPTFTILAGISIAAGDAFRGAMGVVEAFTTRLVTTPPNAGGGWEEEWVGGGGGGGLGRAKEKEGEVDQHGLYL